MQQTTCITQFSEVQNQTMTLTQGHKLKHLLITCIHRLYTHLFWNRRYNEWNMSQVQNKNHRVYIQTAMRSHGKHHIHHNRVTAVIATDRVYSQGKYLISWKHLLFSCFWMLCLLPNRCKGRMTRFRQPRFDDESLLCNFHWLCENEGIRCTQQYTEVS